MTLTHTACVSLFRDNFKERGGQHSKVGATQLSSLKLPEPILSWFSVGFDQCGILLLLVMLLRCLILMSGFLCLLSIFLVACPCVAQGYVLPVMLVLAGWLV